MLSNIVINRAKMYKIGRIFVIFNRFYWFFASITAPLAMASMHRGRYIKALDALVWSRLCVATILNLLRQVLNVGAMFFLISVRHEIGEIIRRFYG